MTSGQKVLRWRDVLVMLDWLVILVGAVLLFEASAQIFGVIGVIEESWKGHPYTVGRMVRAMRSDLFWFAIGWTVVLGFVLLRGGLKHFEYILGKPPLNTVLKFAGVLVLIGIFAHFKGPNCEGIGPFQGFDSLKCGYEPFEGYNNETMSCWNRFDPSGFHLTNELMDRCQDMVMRRHGLYK